MNDLGARAKSLATFLAVAAAICGVHALGLLEVAERPLESLRFRVARRDASAAVVLVAVDTKSLRELGPWPLSAKRYAAALSSLTRAGARRIALDVQFPDRLDAAGERTLADALERAGGGVVVPEADVSEDPDPESLFPMELRAQTIEASQEIPRDADGLVRRYAPRRILAGKTTPSIAAAMADGLSIPGEAFHLDLAINPDSIPRISLSDVLADRYDVSMVAGRAVILGATAPEIATALPLPTGRSVPATVIHALALESLTEGSALRRTGMKTYLAGLPLLFLLYLGVVRAHARRRLVLVLASLAACVLLSLIVPSVCSILLDVSPWMLVIVCIPKIAGAPPVDEDAASARPGNARLQRAEQMMRSVVENSFDAVLQVAGDGVIEIFNEAAQRMFGYTSSQAVGRFVGEIVQPGEGSVGTKLTPDALHPGPTVREAIGIRRDGSKFPVELKVGEMDLAGGRRRVATLRDITERKAHERALEHQARHDALTGLPNRVKLREQVVRALRQAQRDGTQVGFLILDLDRFKEVNDTLGHHVGDTLLQQIGERLQAAIRQSDTIARMGGDEFAVLLPATDPETAKDVAMRLSASLADSFEMQGLSLHIEMSIGIAMFPDDGKDASDVIQRADVAMYVAKRERLGIAVYEPGRDYNSVRHLTLNGELRRAIDDDHLVLYYQPKISAEDGKIIGAEALVRWQHPLFGMIPPDDFIALAEHSGLIKPLTRWVLNEATRQAASWARKGFPIAVAVNVSARNILEKGMAEDISQLLRTNGLPPELLICEITESVIMEDRRRSLEAIMELVRLGVTIAIDDFGTGYSSLSYLRQLPAAEIKIDKSFVMRMDRDKDDAVIVASTIQMAHSLGLRVVAEGVENERIWCTLMAMGCDCGQGYYFSRPIEAGPFMDLLEASSGISPFVPMTASHFAPRLEPASDSETEPAGALP